MTARNIKTLFDLTGKRALITGGSRGLGLQIAHSLGEAGATIVISALKQDELDEAVAELKAAGINATAIAADCGTAEGAVALAAAALKQLGEVDILVNNAGASWGAPMEDYPVEAWDKVMNLNIRGIFVLTQAIGKASMIPRKTGSVISIASIAGLGGNPPFMKSIAYNTSKGAVINFTKTLAAEARDGCDADHAAGFARNHAGLADGLREHEDATNIQVHHLVPRLDRVVLHRRAPAGTGVVDQKVNLTQLLQCGCCKRHCAFRRAAIRRDGGGVDARRF